MKEIIDLLDTIKMYLKKGEKEKVKILMITLNKKIKEL